MFLCTSQCWVSSPQVIQNWLDYDTCNHLFQCHEFIFYIPELPASLYFNRNFFYVQIRGLLNKLTPETFEKLSDDLLNVGLNARVILGGLIVLVSNFRFYKYFHYYLVWLIMIIVIIWKYIFVCIKLNIFYIKLLFNFTYLVSLSNNFR